jgi:hypothetical protein
VTVGKPLLICVLQENFATILKTVVTTVAIDVATVQPVAMFFPTKHLI